MAKTQSSHAYTGELSIEREAPLQKWCRLVTGHLSMDLHSTRLVGAIVINEHHVYTLWCTLFLLGS